MKIEIIELPYFKKVRDHFLKKRRLLLDDYEELKDALREDPELGTVIPQVAGIRKARLKSASKGKRGGFRVFYYYLQVKEKIYMCDILAKNESEDITESEKKALRDLASHFKRGL